MRLGLPILVAACLPLTAAPQENGPSLSWPVAPERAVFLFRNGFETTLAYDRPGAEPIFNYALEAHGFARLDGAGAWQLDHGTASAPRQEAALGELLMDASGIGIQAWVTPPASPSNEERTVFSYGSSPESTPEKRIAPNFEMTQRGSSYSFSLRVGERIEQVTADGPSSSAQHVGLTYGDGRLVLFIDGQEVAARDGLTGGFDAWKPGPLLLGSGSPADSGWAGSLEGFAVHAGALSSEEVLASAEAYGRRVGERKAAPVTRLRARLVARSTVPTPEDIAPYAEALAVYEYEVVQVLEGFYLAKKMRVAHWVVLGETSLAPSLYSVGDEVELAAIDFARNRQLENVYLSDTLPFDFDLRLFFDVTLPLAVGGK